MARLKWPADLTPRMFWVDDQLELRRDQLRLLVGRERLPITPVRFAKEPPERRRT